MPTHLVPVSVGQEERENAARAADDAVWLALRLAHQAGWPEVSDRLLEVKQLTAARRRSLETV